MARLEHPSRWDGRSIVDDSSTAFSTFFLGEGWLGLEILLEMLAPKSVLALPSGRTPEHSLSLEKVAFHLPITPVMGFEFPSSLNLPSSFFRGRLTPRLFSPPPSIAEFMNFFSRTVAERTSAGQRQSIQENSYTAHVYSRASDNLAGVIVTDAEYPVRVVFSLLNKILDEFTTRFRKEEWEQKAGQSRSSGKQVLVEWRELADYILKYQDPKQADTIMKVQQELDETKIILVSDVSRLWSLTCAPETDYGRCFSCFAAQDDRVCS